MSNDPQGSFEWYRSRWGRITMSVTVKPLLNGHVHELNNLLKLIRWQHEHNDEATVRAEYEREARLGDQVEAMAWGKTHETESVEQYELTRNVSVIRPGFVAHPIWPTLVGDSTDFLESEDGTLESPSFYAGEIKCPYLSKNHLSYLRYGMPEIYYNQTQGHMETHDLEEGKFVSYDPRHPVDRDKIYVQMLKRDHAWSDKFRDRMTQFSKHFEAGSRFEHDIGKITDGVPSMF